MSVPRFGAQLLLDAKLTITGLGLSHFYGSMFVLYNAETQSKWV